MAICTKCGATVADGMVFCASCGAPMAPAPNITAGRTAGPASIEHGAGFFASLFDFSFSEFITTKLVKFLYGLGMLLGGVAAVGLIITGFVQSVIMGLVFLVLSPLIFLLYVIGARVWLELVIVVFRIAEHTAEIAKQRGPSS